MIDKKTTHRKDITVWVEKAGISLDVTYDCTFTVTSSESQPGLVDRKVEWDRITPIHVMYAYDDGDYEDEIVWTYGETMPDKITNALETFSSIILGKLADSIEGIR
jgi:hypothetical protein